MVITGTRVDVGTDTDLLLRSLLQRERERGVAEVMSLYLNLDPREFATAAARQSELTSLLDEARREAPQPAWNQVIDQLAEHFDRTDYEIDDAQGLAIVATADGEVELLKLARPVRRRVVFGEHPYLRPLLETLPRTAWCVVLVNSRAGRIMLGSDDELHVVSSLQDDVHGRHDQGGWSQARFQRGIDEEIKDHVRRVARELLPLHQAGMFRRLLAGGPEEIRPILEQALHPYVRPSLAGWLEVDVEHATPTEIHRAALPVIDALERKDQERLFERLREELGQNHRAASGLQPVLDMLNEQRVDTLVLAEGYGAPGMRCRSCGWLGGDTQLESCPVDQGELCKEPDIVECAVEAAIMQSAAVANVGRDAASTNAAHGEAGELIEPDAEGAARPLWLELQGYGSIAALLRY